MPKSFKVIPGAGKKEGKAGRRGTASLRSIQYYSCCVAFCRGSSAEPARGPEGQRDHHHSWPEHCSDMQHPWGTAAPHHLETQRCHPQLPWLGGYQCKCWTSLVIFFLGHWIWLHLTDYGFKGTSFISLLWKTGSWHDISFLCEYVSGIKAKQRICSWEQGYLECVIMQLKLSTVITQHLRSTATSSFVAQVVWCNLWSMASSPGNPGL